MGSMHYVPRSKDENDSIFLLRNDASQKTLVIKFSYIERFKKSPKTFSLELNTQQKYLSKMTK